MHRRQSKVWVLSNGVGSERPLVRPVLQYVRRDGSSSEHDCCLQLHYRREGTECVSKDGWDHQVINLHVSTLLCDRHHSLPVP